MKRLLFIYNGKAGKGTIKGSLVQIIDKFTQEGYDVIAHPTQHRNDAFELAKNRAGEFDIVVCSGGDGTIGEVSSGVYLSGTNTLIGYIPTGSTNDYANSVDLPKKHLEAADCIIHGREHNFDLGQINDRFFIYVAAFGWFTDVSYATDQSLKNMFGHGAYLLEAGKRLFRMPEYEVTVRAGEHEYHEKIVYGMISNTRSVGGMKDFAWKNVDMNDGLFEVTLVKTPQNILELSEAFTCLLSTEPCSQIIRFKAPEISLEFKEAVKWTIDGEEADAYSEVTAKNLHNALRMMVKDNKNK